MSKGVCWRRGYRVLGVVLLWLVVPAEATSGGASALEGAALATTAAGIGAAVNYWAAMEDETAGDIKVLSKGKGIIRLMSTNLRRVKSTNTKANYKSALTNPVFLKVFRSISGISNGKP